MSREARIQNSPDGYIFYHAPTLSGKLRVLGVGQKQGANGAVVCPAAMISEVLHFGSLALHFGWENEAQN